MDSLQELILGQLVTKLKIWRDLVDLHLGPAFAWVGPEGEPAKARLTVVGQRHYMDDDQRTVIQSVMFIRISDGWLAFTRQTEPVDSRETLAEMLYSDRGSLRSFVRRLDALYGKPTSPGSVSDQVKFLELPVRVGNFLFDSTLRSDCRITR